jgi:fructan beta-fructosidase
MVYRLSTLLLVGVVLHGWWTVFALAQERYREPFRPQFHFTPERNWMNDPNGMVFYDGEWHLFYQYNPQGDRWGHMSWGHAVSRDLVRWEHLPLALPEADGIMIFSGSAVVDWKNTSELGAGDKPPLVAIYTGHREGRQDQRIAFSNDRGRTWTKFAGNPVIDLKMADFRDPKVMWHESKSQWVMTVALPAEKKVHFYASPDLKHWKYVGEFGPAGATDGVWECPDLFPLRLDGGETKWVLIVNINPGGPAGGSGCQYFVGDFDGNKFTRDPSTAARPGSDQPLWADYGTDFYAGVSWSDVPQSDGRRIWLGWMSNWNYANDVPTAPWRSAMSIPRELRLIKTADGLRLRQSPVAELKTLRGNAFQFAGGTVTEANNWLRQPELRSGPMEIHLELEHAEGLAGVRLYAGKDQATVVTVDCESKRVLVDRTKSGQTMFHPKFASVQSAPLTRNDGRVALRLFVDTSSVEVFVNDGEQVLTSLIFPDPNQNGIELFGTEKTKVVTLDVWPLRSAW